MVTIMQNDYLEHSSGPWKKHKYFKKIGEGANAVYKYAKNADKNITGSAYKKEAKDEKERAEYANELAGHSPKAIRVGRDVDNVKKDGSADFKFTSPDQWSDSAAYHGRKAAEAESNYYNKSLAGKAEKTAKSAMNKAKERVRKAKESTKTKATVTDTKTGKKRSVDPNDKLYQALEKEAKKNGGFKTRIKFKHDGMDDYAATADYGQTIIDEMLGR